MVWFCRKSGDQRGRENRERCAGGETVGHPDRSVQRSPHLGLGQPQSMYLLSSTCVGRVEHGPRITHRQRVTR